MTLKTQFCQFKKQFSQNSHNDDSTEEAIPMTFLTIGQKYVGNAELRDETWSVVFEEVTWKK